MSDTLPEAVDREPYKRTRGPQWISYLWLVWRQTLAFLDLNGTDGRPSATKITAAVVTMTMCGIGIIGAWKGAEQPWNWPMFWTQLAVIAVLFGRAKFSEYLSVLKGKDTPPGLDA